MSQYTNFKKEFQKKEFQFEGKLYKEVSDFIQEDIERGRKNFSVAYTEAMEEYKSVLNKRFCGRRYRLPLMESEPGSEKWSVCRDSDVNFGSIWESVACKFISAVRERNGFEAWPNKITQFPDFREDSFVGDFKACLTHVYSESKANITTGKPVGCLMPNGVADLYRIEEYRRDITEYRRSGVLSDHLKALIVFAVYEYKYDERSGEKYAVIHDVIVCPALFCVNFRTNGTLALRSGKVTLGFQERNIDFITQKNFGV